MLESVLLFALGVLALVGLLNALRPSRGHLAFFSWMLAWVTIEAAPYVILFDAVAAGVLVALGGLDHWLGWVGLAGVLIAAGSAAPMIFRARRTVIDMGDVRRELDPDEAPSPYPRIQIALPFLMFRRRGVRHVRGVRYSGRMKLDVYLPRTPAERPRPAVIWVHGGGWIIGSRREQAIPLLNHLAANGFVCFSIDYRLSPRATWPDHIVDVKRAIAWVREHADDYGVDPSFVAIAGGSAGGHLSALAALTADDRSLQPGFEDADTSVAAAAPFYGAYDFVDERADHLPIVHWVLQRLVFKARRDDDPEPFRQASPTHRVHAGAPPMFVIHGELDSLLTVAEARRFADSLREVSDEPVLYAEMKGGQHAFDLIPTWRTVPVVEAVERFFSGVYRQRAEPGPAKADRLEDALAGDAEPEPQPGPAPSTPRATSPAGRPSSSRTAL